MISERERKSCCKCSHKIRAEVPPEIFPSATRGPHRTPLNLGCLEGLLCDSAGLFLDRTLQVACRQTVRKNCEGRSERERGYRPRWSAAVIVLPIGHRFSSRPDEIPSVGKLGSYLPDGDTRENKRVRKFNVRRLALRRFVSLVKLLPGTGARKS